MERNSHKYNIVKDRSWQNTFIIEDLEEIYCQPDCKDIFNGAAALLAQNCDHNGWTQLYMSYRHDPDENGNFSIDFNPLYNKDGEYILVEIPEECPFVMIHCDINHFDWKTGKRIPGKVTLTYV